MSDHKDFLNTFRPLGFIYSECTSLRSCWAKFSSRYNKASSHAMLDTLVPIRTLQYWARTILAWYVLLACAQISILPIGEWTASNMGTYLFCGSMSRRCSSEVKYLRNTTKKVLKNSCAWIYTSLISIQYQKYNSS